MLFLNSNQSYNDFIKKRCVPVQDGQVTLNVRFLVVDDLFPYNAIMGYTWFHKMKVIPSTYHQMASYLTENDKSIYLVAS